MSQVVRLPDRGGRTGSSKPGTPSNPDKIGKADLSPTAAEAHEQEAIRLRRWLERILAAGDGAGPWSVERLCRKAGVAPTTITRFLRNCETIPRLVTLNRIAQAAGVPAPGVTMTTSATALVDVPVISPQVFIEQGLEGATVGSRTAVRAPAKYAECVAVMITADTGTLAGVLAGDLVIVDPKTPPAFNDLVVVALDTGAAAIYRVQGAYLVPQGAGSFDALSLENSTVIGIARQVIRDIR